jgi:hypothetical protein
LEIIIIGKILEIRGLYSVNSIVSPKILTKKKLAKFLISQKCKEKEKSRYRLTAPIFGGEISGEQILLTKFSERHRRHLSKESGLVKFLIKQN